MLAPLLRPLLRPLLAPAVGAARRAQPGTALLLPGFLSPLATFSRAQAGGDLSGALAANGLDLTTYGADVPRFNGAAGEFLIYQGLTNSVINPRGLGFTAGTPGTQPGNWFISNGGAVTRTIIGSGVESGRPYHEFTLAFSGAGSANIAFQDFVTCAAGQDVTGRALTVVTAGGTNCTSTITTRFRDAGTSVISAVAQSTTLPTTIAAALADTGMIRRMVAPASTATVGFLQTITASAAASITLRCYVPLLVVGADLAEPMTLLPADGVQAASTHGAENCRFTGSAFSTLFPTGEGTILFRARLPQAAPASREQVILDVSDGTANNRFTIVNAVGGSSILLARALAGAGLTTPAGTMTAGTAFRIGLTWTAAGVAWASIDGGAEVSLTGGPTSGLSRLQFGALSTLAGVMNGAFRSVVSLPRATAPGELAPMVGAL
jgi:hypothetical protein